MTTMRLLGRFGRGASSREPLGSAAPAKTKIGYLTSSEFFHGLTDGDMAEVDRITTMTTCRRGRVFYTPGESGEVLFVLKRGRVQLYRIAPDGKRLVIGSLGAGAVFGEMGLIGQGMYDTYAEAEDNCTLCVMSRADVERLIGSKPLFAVRLMELLGRRLQDAELALERFAFRSVPSRLASLLLALTDDHGELRGLSHQDLADRIGTHRETATRALSEFRAAGAIEIGRGYLKIVDAAKLARVAEQG